MLLMIIPCKAYHWFELHYHLKHFSISCFQPFRASVCWWVSRRGGSSESHSSSCSGKLVSLNTLRSHHLWLYWSLQPYKFTICLNTLTIYILASKKLISFDRWISVSSGYHSQSWQPPTLNGSMFGWSSWWLFPSLRQEIYRSFYY